MNEPIVIEGWMRSATTNIVIADRECGPYRGLGHVLQDIDAVSRGRKINVIDHGRVRITIERLEE